MLISESISHSSRVAYSTAVRNYEHFCSSILSTHLAWPATEQNLILWISFLSTVHSTPHNVSRQPLKYKTIKLYLSALGTVSEQRGFINPTHNAYQLSRALKGVKRIEDSPQRRERYPVTTTLIQQISSVINQRSYHDVMIFAAFTMATYALLRAGEFTSSTSTSNILLWRDIIFKDENNLTLQTTSFNAIHNSTQYIIHLRKSKTDIERQGAFVRVAAPIAVKALLSLTQRMQFPLNSMKPVFSASYSMEPLSRQQLVNELRFKLRQINHPINPMHYSGHSFRRGGASSLLEAGVSHELIQYMGRWATNSQSTKLYFSTNSYINAITNASRSM